MNRFCFRINVTSVKISSVSFLFSTVAFFPLLQGVKICQYNLSTFLWKEKRTKKKNFYDSSKLISSVIILCTDTFYSFLMDSNYCRVCNKLKGRFCPWSPADPHCQISFFRESNLLFHCLNQLKICSHQLFSATRSQIHCQPFIFN